MSYENDLRKKFIVDENDYNKKRVQKLAEKVIEFAKVSENGAVVIEQYNLSTNDKLKLVMASRYIAHSFNSNIPETFSLVDAEKILQKRKEAVGSLLSKLNSSNFTKKVKRGVYVIYPYKIEPFLDELYSRYHNVEINNRKGKKRKSKAVTGVGRDILDLINEHFFDTPKTISEVEKKLKEEVKFHDKRVIDKTIRKTFVSSKKMLKRIPNESGGRATWQYVVRST